MTNNRKILITGVSLLGIVVIAYYFFKNKKLDGGGGSLSPLDNFSSVKVNLGNVKSNKDNIVVVPFNDNKNTAQFYNNNRIIIFDKTKSPILKGNYSDGGKEIKIDGGKTVNNASVWTNLNLLINK